MISYSIRIMSICWPRGNRWISTSRVWGTVCIQLATRRLQPGYYFRRPLAGFSYLDKMGRGPHRSSVSRSPMCSARAGSGLVRRCTSSPPSQRKNETVSPNGLRDKTRQCPPAISHRRSVSNADSFTISRIAKVAIARGLPMMCHDRLGIDDHNHILSRIHTRLRLSRTYYGPSVQGLPTSKKPAELLKAVGFRMGTVPPLVFEVTCTGFCYLSVC
jgi:hypothetical protein